MTAHQARQFILPILVRWHRQIVWKVECTLHSGEVVAKWFKREQAAREWSALVANAKIKEISYTVRECKEFGFVDDQIHYVVNP